MENIINKKKKILFFLLCLYPWFLISGPFLSDAIGVIFSIYFIYNRILEKNFDDFKTIPFILFCLFCLYIFINSIFIGQNLVSIKSSVFFFRFGLFALAISFLLNENQDNIKFFFFSLTAALCLLFFDSIFQKTFGFNIIGIEMAHRIRVSSFFGDELILGSFVVKILPIILAFLFHLYEEKSNKYSLILILISLITIMLSAEKASLAMMILFTFSFFIMINYNLKIKFSFILIFFSIIFSVIIIDKPIQKRLYHELINNSGKGKYIYSAMHDSHFRTAYKMFVDKPYFGHGPKMYRFKCNNEKYKINQYSCSTHPHNFVLQILSETGISGFIFFLLFYIGLLLVFFKNLKLGNSYKNIYFTKFILSTSLIITFFPLATSGNIFNNWSSSLHFLTLGILIYFLRLNISKSTLIK